MNAVTGSAYFCKRTTYGSFYVAGITKSHEAGRCKSPGPQYIAGGE